VDAVGQPSRIHRDWPLEIDSTNNFELTKGNLVNSVIDHFESMMYAGLLFRRLRALFYIRKADLGVCGTQLETNRKKWVR